MAANPAVKAARSRRVASAARDDVRIESFVDKVARDITLTMRQRMHLTVSFLRSRVVKNISVPVKKEKSAKTGRIVVTQRSKRGEFPRADTTQLMKTIFGDVDVSRGVIDGFIGTPLDYGVILETSKRLDRSFLVRTLREERPRITKMLTGPIRGV
jgi:hypothetical protein